jgi:ArsR family transcriptional regulator, arsenate/arsenite/antimonite-responsive transcriptional repressor
MSCVAANSNLHGDLVRLLRGLSDPNRLRLLNLLSHGEVCVCHLADCLGMVQPKISRHLAYLKRVGLVTTRRQGKWIHYRRARHPHPASVALVNALQTWMKSHPRMSDERRKLQSVCCRSKQKRRNKK